MSEHQSERAVRARASKHGFRVAKSRVRQPHHNNQGDFQLIDVWTNAVILGANFDASIEDINSFLRE